MAYENLEAFYRDAAFLAGTTERHAVAQLEEAAKVIGPLALKSGILQPNVQIVQPHIDTVRQMGPGGLRLALRGKEKQAGILERHMATEQKAIIKSYKPIATGWTVHTTPRQDSGYSEKVMLSTEGTLAVIGGFDVRMPEEGLLTAPRRLKETPPGFSPAYDALLQERRLTGMITVNTYEKGHLGRILDPLLSIEGVAAALQSFAEDIGIEDAVAAQRAGEEWPPVDEHTNL